MLLAFYLFYLFSTYKNLIYLWYTYPNYDLLILLTIHLWFTHATYDLLMLLIVYLWFTYPGECWFRLFMIYLFCLGQSSVQAFLDPVSCYFISKSSYYSTLLNYFEYVMYTILLLCAILFLLFQLSPWQFHNYYFLLYVFYQKGYLTAITPIISFILYTFL